MGGYIIAAVMIGPVTGTTTCYGLFCWRWPLLVEWIMLVPFCVAVHFVPANHLVMRIGLEADRSYIAGGELLQDETKDGFVLLNESTIPSTFSPNSHLKTVLYFLGSSDILSHLKYINPENIPVWEMWSYLGYPQKQKSFRGEVGTQFAEIR